MAQTSPVHLAKQLLGMVFLEQRLRTGMDSGSLNQASGLSFRGYLHQPRLCTAARVTMNTLHWMEVEGLHESLLSRCLPDYCAAGTKEASGVS
jgi:hypothetical protein